MSVPPSLSEILECVSQFDHGFRVFDDLRELRLRSRHFVTLSHKSRGSIRIVSSQKKRRKSLGASSEALARMPELAQFLPAGGMDAKARKEARAPRVLRSDARRKIV